MNDKYNLLERLDDWDESLIFAKALYELGIFSFFKGNGFDTKAFLFSLSAQKMNMLCRLITKEDERNFKTFEILAVIANFLSLIWRRTKESPEFADILQMWYLMFQPDQNQTEPESPAS